MRLGFVEILKFLTQFLGGITYLALAISCVDLAQPGLQPCKPPLNPALLAAR
jgi:hypothetical protein